MNLRLPRFQLARRAGPGASPGELRETQDGAAARLESGGEMLEVRVPADDGPVRLSGVGDCLVFLRLADGTIRPLSGMAEAPIELDLRPGDALVGLTPGAARAAAPDGEPFGAHRIAAFLHLHDPFNAPRLAERLLAEIEAHAAGRTPVEAVGCVVVEAR